MSVSYPRSGHHLLANMLFKYFSKNLDFQNTDGLNEYPEIICAGELIYCDYYNHCKTPGCTDETVNFQKNHDLDLSLKKEDYKYIIQYRGPVEANVSLFEFAHKKDLLKDGLKKEWENHSFGMTHLWVSWMIKWFDEAKKDPQNFIILTYEDLVKDTEDWLTKVVKFIDPSNEPDTLLIKEIIKKQKIRTKTRDIKEFIYYDEEFIKILKDCEQRAYKLLGLK